MYEKRPDYRRGPNRNAKRPKKVRHKLTLWTPLTLREADFAKAVEDLNMAVDRADGLLSAPIAFRNRCHAGDPSLRR